MTAGGRGREYGAAWSEEIQAGLAGYLRLFGAVGASVDEVRSWAERALEEIQAWAPELAEEIAGIATGAGMPVWQVGAVNARTEILAAVRARGPNECSTAVSVPLRGTPRTIQTWDWNDSLRDTPMAWIYEPRHGHVVRGLTEFGILGKIGVNSAGLGVHFNILRHASDHDRIGVPVHAVARHILDEASTVDQATEIARSARLSASTVLTVVAHDGERGSVAGLELSPAGVGMAEPDDDGFYVHTNHFLDASLSGGERLGTVRPNTYDRLKRMRARGAGLSSADLMTRVEAMLSHAEDGAPVCCHASADDPFELRSETLATVSIDVADGRLMVHRGGPCQVARETWQRV
ncbi:peptidase C45 [Phytoactinopolyspora alkaliphila]|uniref:Peptidase C45 n=2 Tax=Phytoactinopolyspora alkaliphila TaxID=1783498 RepID=A0A6N9YHH5_9ACTN|nr:peptidase C45 [Phytoactinopolyspora alkaliphila]